MGVDATIRELAQAAREAGRLAIDTEFMGEGRYQALLCLVQVAVEDDGGVRVEVLDPLTGSFDPSPLAAALADPAVEVLVHAGRQDVALLRRSWRTEVRALFDMQVAAGFSGRRAQLGYESLLAEALGVRLRKSASFTRWDMRPLSAEQVEYAREDVLHLAELADVLQGELRERGRLEWAREECRALEEASDERDVEAVFARLPRVHSLDGGQCAVARELVRWREDIARESDRPVSSVLPDAALVEIAKRRPRDSARLAQIRGLHEGIVRRRGRAILEVVEAARALPAIELDHGRPPPVDPRDAALVALGEALVRARATDAALAYELLAARADLQRIVAALREGQPEPAVRTLQGWRRELVGAELLELLGGRRALRVRPDGHIDILP